jgi:hypothetical protein
VLESIGALADTPIAEAEAKAVLDSEQQEAEVGDSNDRGRRSEGRKRA